MLRSVLFFAVAIAAAASAAALTYQIISAYSRGGKRLYAKPQGSASGGIMYAFGQGMLPWEKESAAKHLSTYFAGVFYHLAIFAALALLTAVELSAKVPQSVTFVLRIILLLGLVCGVGLLVKRAAIRYMRAISCPDDIIANLLVDILVGAALAATFSSSYVPVFQIVSIVLLLYIPLGKIRHCVFFFFTRILFGIHFGRRGVVPHRSSEA